MYIIAKINEVTQMVSYLYKTRKDRFAFANVSNMNFNTEEEAINFIHFRFDSIKQYITDNDKLIVVPKEGDEDD